MCIVDLVMHRLACGGLYPRSKPLKPPNVLTKKGAVAQVVVRQSLRRLMPDAAAVLRNMFATLQIQVHPILA